MFSELVGVFSADKLSDEVNRKPRLYVVNTDVAAGLGLHWVAFYFPEKGVGEFFSIQQDKHLRTTTQTLKHFSLTMHPGTSFSK